MKKALLIFFYRTYINTLAILAPSKAGEAGFFLFCHPRRRAVKPHHLEFLNTAEKFDLEYAGKKVQGYKWGNGEKKLLLIHGWESHSYWWKNIVTNLSKEKYTLISVDAPGHGLSEGSYINIHHYSGLIEKIVAEEKNVHAILAHSLGASSTAYTLFRMPQLKTSKIVLMAAPGEVKDYIKFYKNLLKLTDRAMNEINKQFIERIGHLPEYFSLKEFAKTLEHPGLLIHDTEDKEAPYKYAFEAHQNWKNSELLTTTGLGHNLKSTDLIKKVEEFLN